MIFSDKFKPNDKVIAIRDFFDEIVVTGKATGKWILKGEIDIIESISSDHHGGEQLNLVKWGRGWSLDLWQKYV